MTIEEKRNVIKNYCIGRDCNKCVLYFRRGACYSDSLTVDRIIEENYKLVMMQMKNEEAKEKLIETGDRGSMTIKGTCYEDVLNILCRNGYKTTMITEPCKKNLGEIEHKIIFWKEPVSDNSYQE